VAIDCNVMGAEGASIGKQFALLSQLCIPMYVRRRAQRSVRDVESNFSMSSDSVWMKKLARPLVAWMFEFVTDMQNIVPKVGRELTFEFSFSVSTNFGDEDDECVARSTVPMWNIVIRDINKQIVHKNWIIAIDQEGDLCARRVHVSCLRKISADTRNEFACEDAYHRVCDVVREYLRLHAFCI
jgi:hypothetical protein